jgi:tetratricopeptide (TPR) repeat protein
MSRTSSSATRDSLAAGRTDAERLACVRYDLQRGEFRSARVHFQCLPDVASHRHQWIHQVLHDIFTSGFVDFTTAIRFLEELPDLLTALHGCLVLHRAKAAFETESTRGLVLPTTNLARLVRKLKCELTGRARSQAESYWNAWFRPTTHAIVMGKAVVIEASARREALYAASATYAFDADRRNVFGWRQQWTPQLVHKEQWKLVPVDDAKWDKFYLQSVAYGEYLYVDTRHRLGEGSAHGVFLWRNSKDPDASVGEAAHWELVPIGPPADDAFAIYNPYSHTYLSANGDVFDSERRFLTTASQEIAGLAWQPEHTWRIRPQRMTPIEKGVALFYEKQYAAAEHQFSLALETAAELEFLPKLSCYAYRMACHARLGKRGSEGDGKSIQSDLGAIDRLGGAKAALLYGVYDRWKEGAAVLGEVLPVNDEPQGCVHSVSVLQSHLERGMQCLLQKQYDRALAAFREVTTIQLNASDTERRALKASAQLHCAKTYYAMGMTDEALVLLEAMDRDGKSEGGCGHVPLDTEVRVLLLTARCLRTLKQFDKAIALLQHALERLSCLPETGVAASNKHTEAKDTAWLQQSILVELRLVGIFQRQYLDRLLASKEPETRCAMPVGLSSNQSEKNEEPQLDGELEAEQLVNLFQCPLTLELMRDPVVTPNGNTYEREMIERHIDSVGPWDPLTRQPLAKTELHANRALKTLMATMLSEHRLGRLLAELS